MIKKILIGLASVIILAIIVLYFTSRPTLEDDGSYSPSSLALTLGTVSTTDYEAVEYNKYQGNKSKILVIFTEEKNLEMKNGKLFSTGNHPIEALVPMLHLQNAGFDFEIVTPTGKPVVFEMWAFPKEDENVKAIYNQYKSNFEQPKKLADFNCTQILDCLIDYLNNNNVGAYGSNQFPFYNLHARQYLLIALGRVSVDHPALLIGYKNVFVKYAQLEPHILIQKFSADIALNIEKSIREKLSYAPQLGAKIKFDLGDDGLISSRCSF